MAMREGETLKMYSDRYWEMFNVIDGDFDDVADRGYDVKQILVNQGSGAEIMYLDLYKGLKLKLEDLADYDSPLVGFYGKVVISKGQIRLPAQAGLKVVEVNFIVVDAYSPYTTIVARPWLHAIGAVSSTLHLKVKYPSDD
ncbi:uncharacterized protein LOC142620608 [Castanea sativa]|uniref:uncharacterized protein LOC142620608 n=1 Tax=Castanea sativa TaxID=21020 RepID=UPI003F64AB32